MGTVLKSESNFMFKKFIFPGVVCHTVNLQFIIVIVTEYET